MLELSSLGVFFTILGTLLVPRFVFIVFWICATGAVGAVIEGAAIPLAIIGWFILPRTLMAYFLIEAMIPGLNAMLYAVYVFIALILDIDDW